MRQSWTRQSRVAVICQAKKSKKKQREYGSGRADLGIRTDSKQRQQQQPIGGGGSSAAEYLHFGRLIGESVEESSERLKNSSIDVSSDKRAEMYLEKWSLEEDMSYEMFETLLSNDPRSAKASAVKQVSFEELMSGDEEEINAAFQSMFGVTNLQDEKEETVILDTEEPVESPTYDAFDSLLGGGDNRVEASQKATFDECEDTDEFHKEDKMSPVNNNQKNTAGRKHNNKNSSRIQAALSLLASKERVDARVFQANAAGVLVSLSSDKKPRKHHSDHQENQITAFVPFSQLSKEHAKKVVDAQKKAKISLGASADDDPAVIRKAGMSVLLNNVLQVTVLSVDEDQQRVVCTERTDNRNRAPALTESVAKKISSRIGEIVQNATVCNITDFGVFVTFHLPGIADDDDQASLVGLVYSSELCWDERSSLDISIGDRVKAQIIHVDVEKRHIFLSIKRTEPNPLLETLDQLLATPQQRDVSLSSNAAAGSSRETFDTAENTDLRPLLGDLLEAVNLVEVLHAAGFPTAVMGPRLQSKIVSSQNIELYVSKNEPESRMIRLVVRKGYDVQQIEISGDSNVRQSLMVTLSKLDL